MGTRKRYLSGLLAAALALTLLTGGQPVWAAQAPGGEDTSDMAVESAFSDVKRALGMLERWNTVLRAA